MTVLEIKNLHVTVEGKEILKGLNLTIRQGEIHAVMGPNGSGKSTLALTLMGHPKYKIEKGDILVDGQSILTMKTDARSKLGLFLAFQYPLEVNGVSLSDFLRTAYNALHGNEAMPLLSFRKFLEEKLEMLKMDKNFASRYLNEGFSGGEKKRCEVLQLAVLQPKIAILDETDSGLDIDSIKVVADGINMLAGPNLGVLLITHYNRILKYVHPHYVHVLVDGRIVESGGKELATKLEEKGYDWIKEKNSA